MKTMMKLHNESITGNNLYWFLELVKHFEKTGKHPHPKLKNNPVFQVPYNLFYIWFNDYIEDEFNKIYGIGFSI